MTFVKIGCAALTLAVVLSAGASSSSAQQPAGAVGNAEVQLYEAFRLWLTQQPPDVQAASDAAIYERYRADLRRQGKPEREIESTIASLATIGDRAEIERWNRILTAPIPRFNTSPNGFLVSVLKNLKPGRSLDVGMGQGRNTIYLAQQGWESVGSIPPTGRSRPRASRRRSSA
jgi:hypothetical protein